MNSLIRKVLRPFKPVAKVLIPGYFKYDTVKYWTKIEGSEYYDKYRVNYDNTEQARVQEETLMAEIRMLEFDSIFEYGCGYGRILKLVENEFKEKQIEGCDVSIHQLNNSHNVLSKDTKCNLFLVDGKSIPRKDKFYDVSYICNVLQHQTHSIINDVRSEIMRVTKKYIILMEPTHTQEEEDADKNEGALVDKTCYRHNHTGYFESKGCKILKFEWVPIVGNFIIVIQIKH
jgi:ubiquinone/menaquinone biosynthesis C-methylase UbiE